MVAVTAAADYAPLFHMLMSLMLLLLSIRLLPTLLLMPLMISWLLLPLVPPLLLLQLALLLLLVCARVCVCMRVRAEAPR